MTDLEFDVLDELYFVQSYQELQEEVELTDPTLKETLSSLSTKGYIKCLKDHDRDFTEGDPFSSDQFKSLFFLATKKGLLAHNGR